MEPDAALRAFKTEIRNFLKSSGMARSRLGGDALNDPSFCYRLFEKGIEPTLATMRKVLKFIRAHKP